jgi:exonuclease SbcC
MRPLRLSVEGFACFRDKQELDFTSLDLFAISGPTGAGKSSLLDAMIFALYGKVPRVGKRYSECISLGRDRLAVTFDFRVGQRRFRITRIGRRRSAGSVQLDEIIESSDETKPLADQVGEVNRQVETLLGLGYDAFTQAVVLPQNEFAEFLQSDPSDRRKILSSLLRLDVYERMMKRAGVMASKIRGTVEGYERRLAEDYAGATPQAVEDLAKRIDEVATQNHRREEDLAVAQKLLDRTKDRYEKTKDLEQQRGVLGKLRANEPAMIAAERRLATARRAAPVVPLLDAADAAEEQATDLAARKKGHEAVIAKAERTVEECDRQLEIAKRDAAEVPALNKRIRALDELKGAIKSRELAGERLSAATTSATIATKERDARQKELTTANKELAAHEKLVTRLEAAVTAIGFNPSSSKKLDGWRDRASQLSEQRAASLKTTQAAAVAEQRATDERAKADAATRRLRDAEKELENATAAFGALDGELRACETEHSAALLRADLKIGEACPVCLRSVDTLPHKGRTPKLDGLRARHASAKQKLDDLEKEVGEIGRATSRVVASAEKLTERSQELRDEADGLAKAVARLEAKLEENLGELVAGKKIVPIETRVLEAVAADSELRERFEAATTERDEAIKKRTTLERARDKLAAAAATAADKLTALETRAQEQRDEIDRVTADIRKVTKRDDPLAEREELAARCKELEDRASLLEDELTAAKQTLSEETTKAKEMARQLQQLQKAAARQRKDADASLREAELGSAEDARGAIIAAAEQRRMEKEVETHKRDTHAAKQRIAELEAALGGQLVAESEYSKVARDFQQVRAAHDGGIRLEASLREQHAELERKLNAAQKLTKQLEHERTECRHYEQLATDLRSDRFQEFILREAFAELVARASGRLFKLSGRYTLDMCDGEFDVLDRDNAGERRSARTLSGGETFLASLALALELSEQVQRAAGAVALDSLFIDEGFGSLDAEALDIATDAVQSLPQGGRMVGIITHISELTARLDARVVVEKRAEGSRVRVEVG